MPRARNRDREKAMVGLDRTGPDKRGTVDPPFVVVSGLDLEELTPIQRRNWAPMLEAMRQGHPVFLSDADLTDRDLRYLGLAIARAGLGEGLRSRRMGYHGMRGRVLWMDLKERKRQVPFRILESDEELEDLEGVAAAQAT